MDTYRLLVELHKTAGRQGPGSSAETRKALELAQLGSDPNMRIADIGCGTGASTLVLARQLPGHITAVDLSPDFLQVLQQRAQLEGLRDRISTLACSMDALLFEQKGLDLIWSEGAVYTIGFEQGISYWRQFLKPGGKLVVSEITWLTDTRPNEIHQHWVTEYPHIVTASQNIRLLEKHGYIPVAYFVLPSYCWVDNYYRPLMDRFDRFLVQHGRSEEAEAIVAAERHEIALYEQYSAYYSYGFYVAERRG